MGIVTGWEADNHDQIFIDELERELAGIAPVISLPTVARLEPEPALGA
jgi:hypothetical protein